jgi:heat shock protein HslJ
MHATTITKRPTLLALFALLSLVISACVPITPAPAGQEPTAEATAAPAEEGAMLTLEDVTWQLTEFVSSDGAAATPVAETTLTFQDGQVGGSTGCNSFSAAYTVDGQKLTVEQGMSTMMACEEPIMAQEQAVLANLNQAASYEIVDNQLHILDAAGKVVLTFEQQVSAALTGVTWQATNYNNGKQAVVNVLDGTEITALFAEDGTLSGKAGCNNYTASYTVDGNQISIGPGATTRMMCAEPAGIMEQEAAYVAALETAATYTIQGDVLELRTAEDALVARFVVGTAVAVDAGAAESIVDTTSQWVETAYGNDTTLTVDDPSKYTLT